MEEKDSSLMMSFPSIPPNFISLQKLQQLRLQEKQDAKKNKQEEERKSSLKVEERQTKVLEPVQVTEKPISSTGFYYNHNERQIKGATEKVASLKTLEQIDFEKSKEKSKEEKKITKPTTSNGNYNKKKWQNERRIRKEEVGSLKTLEQIDFEKPKKNKEKEEEAEVKVLDGEITKPTSSNGFYRKREEGGGEMGLELQGEIDLKKFQSKGEGEMGLGLKSPEEIDLEKAEKKEMKTEKKMEWYKKIKGGKLRKKLDRQRTLVDENASDEKEIISIQDKNGISVNPMMDIVVDDVKKKMKMEEKEEVNGGQSWRRKKKQPFITNVATTSAAISNPTAEIVRNFDQKGKNRRSMVATNRGFGGGFGNGRNANGRNGDNDEKNLMWVKKGESMNSSTDGKHF